VGLYMKRFAALSLALSFLIGGLTPAAAIESNHHITWVDFSVPAELMREALEWDIENRGTMGAGWIEVLACLAAKCGGDFRQNKPKAMRKLLEKLEEGESMAELTGGLNNYAYYLEAYTAVLGGLAGEYAVEVEKDGGEKVWEDRYGLRAFHPIAKGFEFCHYDDFGGSRSYGYKRKHLGHDIIAPTGTPVAAVESGIVEELGWNKYGGWRVGIRSFDSKRYYYYAHMRQNRPYAEGLEKGGTVLAGDVIGYVGRTGYSDNENTNGIKTSHLHFGIQLIFDESQKEGPGEIWIDPYEITKLLSTRRSAVQRNPETKEYTRSEPYKEIPCDACEECFQEVAHSPGGLTVNAAGEIQLPVVMYHSIQKNRSKLGRYTISPEELEADFKWLQDNGYRSVTIDQLVMYTEGKSAEGSPLPEKPVFLTFDDGYYDNMYYADPLLKKYGFTAAIFVVGDFIDKSEREGCQNPNYSYASRRTLEQMAQEGYWEIESHSYSLHLCNRGRDGVKRKHGESDEAYERLLRDDFSKIGELIEGVAGRRPRAFAYPFGSMSGEAESVLREMGYKITLSCSLGIAEIRAGEPDTLYKMKRILRPSGKALSGLI
jgi:peptidoglycan/xylan/chitin deacetylase (PgdA/CDA1 family)